MNTITIWNKGRRHWDLKGPEGKMVSCEPQESCQVEEVYGLRMVAAYPKDLTTTGVAGPSIDDIKRREQSVNDREKHLDAREKALDEREKALEAREKGSTANSAEETKETPAKPRGRPAKSDKAE